ncbi:hypothetical protein [Pararhizobium sp. PWRC1-1]|uniref:hypothetical protein n=1 Tax=Pararhizobium sp. PWRC1-1 TaxID=2804566 RepID=UPI003CE95690
MPEHHESLIGVLSSIRDARESDESDLLDAESKAKDQQIGRLAIGKSALDVGGTEIEGIWETQNCRVTLRNKGDGHYIGTGEVSKEVKQGGLVGLFTSNLMSIETSKVVIQLARFGNALEGTLTIESSARPLSLLGSFNSEKRLVLHLSENGTKIEGLEIGYDEKPISWHRSDQSAIGAALASFASETLPK